MRAQRPDLQGLDRELEVIDRAGGGREMEHTVQIAFHVDEVGHIVAIELETVVPEELADVVR